MLTQFGRRFNASQKRVATEVGAGVARIRGCVTIRTKPLKTMFAKPNGSCASTISANQSR